MQRSRSRWVSTGVCAIALGIAAPGVLAGDDEAAADRLDAVVERYDEAQANFMDALRAAGEDGEKVQAAFEKQPKAGDFVPAFIEVAKMAPASQVEAESWMWVMKLAEQDQADDVKEGLQVLLENHIESKALNELPSHLGYGAYKFGEETCMEGLRALMGGSPHEGIQAGATYHMARMVKGKGQLEDARMLFNELGMRYGELSDGSGRTYGALAEGNLFEMENLTVGKPAPDIEGDDLNGVSFKRSDYRGKVVLLDFWGHW